MEQSKYKYGAEINKESEEDGILIAFTKFLSEKQISIPYNLNILDEQCGHIVENSHTNILMKILQYKNQHGYVFLENFFKYLEMDNIGLDPCGDVRFKTEKYYKCDSKNGRIDGFIFQKDRFVLIVENKINGARNTNNQIKTYIEGVINDPNIFENTSETDRPKKIWVMYLTKDDTVKKKPDDDSIKKMCEIGICNIDDKDKEVLEGERYRPVNYQEHILPWIKEEIQPVVMQKEQVLNTGLLQYIDFLDGMFGLRQSDAVLMAKSKDWLIEWLKKENIEVNNKDKFKTTNNTLEKISKEIDKQLMGLTGQHFQNNKDGEVLNTSDLRRGAGILQNLIQEINEEPMQEFYNITRNYFESKNLMKECVIHSIFNYYYIQIRDASWPRSIHFEWYPLGIDRLVDVQKKKKKELEYTLCFHVENIKYQQSFDEEEIKKAFENCGFVRKEAGETSRTLSFYKIIPVPVNPIIKMETDELSNWLTNAYKVINQDLINSIQDKILKIKAIN